MSGVKRFLRGPWPWVALAVVGFFIALQLLIPNGGYKEIDTSEMTAHIQKGDIKKVTFVGGGDQEIRAELKDGKKVPSHWVHGQKVARVNQLQKKATAGTVKFNSKVPKPSLIGSILTTI